MEDLVLLAKRLLELSAHAGAFPNLSSLSGPDREYVTALIKDGPILAQAVIELESTLRQFQDQAEMDQEEQP